MISCHNYYLSFLCNYDTILQENIQQTKCTKFTHKIWLICHLDKIPAPSTERRPPLCYFPSLLSIGKLHKKILHKTWRVILCRITIDFFNQENTSRKSNSFLFLCGNLQQAELIDLSIFLCVAKHFAMISTSILTSSKPV